MAINREELLERLIKCIDQDADGNLSKAELSTFMKDIADESDTSEEVVNSMGDGEKVPADALREVLRNLWEEEPNKMADIKKRLDEYQEKAVPPADMAINREELLERLIKCG